MAYIKPGLARPHVIQGRAHQLPRKAGRRPTPNLGAIISRAKQFPRLPGPYHGDGGNHPHGFPGLNPGRSRPITPPGRFDLSGDVMGPGAFGPRGFPGMGDYKPPPWQTQQPGFYDEGQLGPEAETLQRPPMPPRSDTALRPPWEGRMPQEGVQGLNPKILQLIQMLMGQSRGGPPGGSYM